MPASNLTSSSDNHWLAGIVLSGGGSSRIGFDKGQLLIGDRQGNYKTFLDSIVSSLGQVLETIVIVNNGEEPKTMNSRVIVTSDRRPNRGPLEGIASGLAALPDSVSAAFVTSCDVPLLRGEIVDALLSKWTDDIDALIPVDPVTERVFGLTAIYRTSILPTLDELIEAGELRVADLRKHLKAKEVSLDLLKIVDPLLDSLDNVNSLDDYRALATKVGFEIPAELIKKLQLS